MAERKTPHNDTIVAQATPSGRGGVGIVRVSGPLCREIAQAVLGQIPQARFAHYLPFKDRHGKLIDIGLALYFPGPHSFTGEDVVELHGHGGPVIIDMLIQAVLQHGARPARPGEFSERAFLNNKIDLAQAEAIADLIDAGSEQAARAALRSLQGEFSREVDRLVEAVTQLRVYVEAAIDFSDEAIDFLQHGQVQTRIVALYQQLQAILHKAQRGCVLKEGIHIVLAGQPNVGKSSLLNALAGYDAAIVTPVAGTTRDVVREQIHLGGLPVHIIDTAGLRDSVDVVEQEGVRRTWRAIEQADAVLFMVDDSVGWQAADDRLAAQLPPQTSLIVLHNKVDLTGRAVGIAQREPHLHINIAAQYSQGLDALSAALQQLAGFSGVESGTYMARRRHVAALERAQQCLHEAEQRCGAGQIELVAEELRETQRVLGEITGEVSSDALLGEIFAQFCIGK